MKTLLRYFANKTNNRLLRIGIGAVYGNLELYGYVGTGINVFTVATVFLRGELEKWRTRKTV